MAETCLSIILGSFILGFGFISLSLNICVLYLLIKGHFVSRVSSTFYILSFCNISGCTVYGMLYTFYLGPASILQDFLVTPEIVKFIGYLASMCWGQNILTQLLVAVNRVLVIVYPKTTLAFFSFHNTILLCFLTYVIGAAIAVIGSYQISCCSLILYYKAFAQSFLGNSFNVNGYILYLPLNIFCSFVAVSCYIYLYFFVKANNHKTHNFISKHSQLKRKAQEQSYAFQFSLCSIGCILTWITLRILVLILKTPEHPLYILTTFFILCHTSSNALVLLVFNREVKEQFYLLILHRQFKPRTAQVTTLITPS